MSSIPLDEYIVDVLMPDLVGHDRQPSAFVVYLHLWRLTHGDSAPTAQVALQDIAERTGLSKRSVQGAVAWLAKRNLLSTARASITAVPVYTVLRPWRVERKRASRAVSR
jgi:Helix-turn-helix domain